MCFSHLLLYIVYVGATYANQNDTACTVVSALLHYAILVVLMSILGQAVFFVFTEWKTKYSVLVAVVSFGK